jgi:hypothetical protein
MSDELKVVNPTEVGAYGTRINSRVDEMFNELNTLCTNVVDVDYWGANAFNFKTAAGEQATLFAKSLAKDINTLKENVAKATTNISGSLGGQPITIVLSDNAIAAVAPKPDDGTQIANPTALTDLTSTIGTRFEALVTAINGLKALPANDRQGWMGKARNDTETYVGDWVTAATTKCDEAKTALVGVVDKQNQAVILADSAG